MPKFAPGRHALTHKTAFEEQEWALAAHLMLAVGCATTHRFRQRATTNATLENLMSTSKTPEHRQVMNDQRAKIAPGSLLFLLALGLGDGLLSACAVREKTGLYIKDAYIKTAIPGRTMTAAYATFINQTPETLCLENFSAIFARSIELHETVSVGDPANGRVAMQRLPLLCIEPGKSARLEPGGKHLMVMGLGTLPDPAVTGPGMDAEVTIVLGTTEGRAYEVRFKVRPFDYLVSNSESATVIQLKN